MNMFFSLSPYRFRARKACDTGRSLGALSLVSGLAVLGLSALPAQAQINRLELERVYRNWVGAMTTGHYRGWQEVTASHRQVIAQNLVLSRRGQWPQSLFQLPFQLPEIGTLLHLATLQKGDTAHLIYYGRIDFGLQSEVPPDNIIMLKFLKENGIWKFDNTHFFNLADEPEVRRRAQLGDTSFLDDPQFQPTGTLPETPPKIALPDFAGDLWVVSHGYEATIRIGALHETVVANEEVTTAVLGGLSRDGLPVTVTAREIDFPAGEERLLAVEIYALRPGKKAVRVWEYRPKEGADVSNYTSKVWANAVTIPGG